MKPSFGLFVFSMLFSMSVAWSQEQDYKPVGSGKPEQNTPSETPPEEEAPKKESKERHTLSDKRQFLSALCLSA